MHIHDYDTFLTNSLVLGDLQRDYIDYVSSVYDPFHQVRLVQFSYLKETEMRLLKLPAQHAISYVEEVYMKCWIMKIDMNTYEVSWKYALLYHSRSGFRNQLDIACFHYYSQKRPQSGQLNTPTTQSNHRKTWSQFFIKGSSLHQK